jgi:hypothetical protein
MNKFTKLISNNGEETLVRRSNSLAQNAEIAQQNLLNSLKQKKAELELKIMDLTDLAPEDKDSLRPGGNNWNPNTWAHELQQSKQDLYFLEIQIKLAEDTFKEFFTDGQE